MLKAFIKFHIRWGVERGILKHDDIQELLQYCCKWQWRTK